MCYTHTDRQSYKLFRDYYFEVLNDEKAKSIQEGKKNKRYQHNLIEVQCPPLNDSFKLLELKLNY